jgi:hypothetical protein
VGEALMSDGGRLAGEAGEFMLCLCAGDSVSCGFCVSWGETAAEESTACARAEHQAAAACCDLDGCCGGGFGGGCGGGCCCCASLLDEIASSGSERMTQSDGNQYFFPPLSFNKVHPLLPSASASVTCTHTRWITWVVRIFGSANTRTTHVHSALPYKCNLSQTG